MVARDDAASVRSGAVDPLLTDGVGVPGIAEREQFTQADGSLPVALRGQPDNPERHQQWIPRGHERLETAVGSASPFAPARRQHRDLHVPSIHVLRPISFDPALDEATFERARLLDQEHIGPGSFWPAGLVDQSDHCIWTRLAHHLLSSVGSGVDAAPGATEGRHSGPHGVGSLSRFRRIRRACPLPVRGDPRHHRHHPSLRHRRRRACS